MSCLLALLLAAAAGAEEAVVSQDIVIKGKAAAPPPAALPPPAADPAVLDEVLGSLDVLKTDHAASLPKLRLEALRQRLELPFPEPPYLLFAPRRMPFPYSHWRFEVLGPERVMRRTEGVGRLAETLEWDGTDALGRMRALLGERYRFRFTGLKGKEEFSLESEEVELVSLAYKDNWGVLHMEVSNPLLFAARGAELSEKAPDYLGPVAARMGRAPLEGKPFPIRLYQKRPGTQEAQARAQALVKFFSSALLLNASKFQAEVLALGERGDVCEFLFPAEQGSRLGAE